MVGCIDDYGVVECAVLLQTVQQAAHLTVDFGYGGVVADIAGTDLLVGRLEAAGQALVALPGMGVVRRDVGEGGVFKLGGQSRVVGFGLIG